MAELLRRGQPFPYNYESSWTAAADHILEDVRVQARQEEIVPRLDTEALLRVDEEDFRRKFTAFMELAAGEEPEPS